MPPVPATVLGDDFKNLWKPMRQYLAAWRRQLLNDIAQTLETLHYAGEGVFMVAGKIISRRRPGLR